MRVQSNKMLAVFYACQNVFEEVNSHQVNMTNSPYNSFFPLPVHNSYILNISSVWIWVWKPEDVWNFRHTIFPIHDKYKVDFINKTEQEININ